MNNNLLGKETFAPKNIMACKGLRPHEVANRQCELLTEVLNEGWVLNYDDYNEEKWELWWFLNSPGFRLHDAYFDHTFSGVGPRLSFKTKALALHAAKWFLEIYRIKYTA